MHDLKATLIEIAKAIALSMGETCEAVVHDENRVIIYIENGFISGRQTGHVMDDSVFEYLADRSRKENGSVVRLTKKANGELAKSTTVMFFDENGKYEAMLCFTMNLTSLNQARNMLDMLMNIQPFEANEEQKDNMTIADYTRNVIADIIKEVGKPSTLGPKEIKLRTLRMLDEKGVFLIKDSIPQVCELLSISQATLYNYLREIRTDTVDLLPMRGK
ncbi:helix-turn-helix transcriptional regulator [Bacilliculturomica massiliensis]|uniref:helix-turn-helix transcriptional regulator n=1 Tax=Bacilliculturomica massiliensis TaxID=1917867 RepID=UPI0013EF4B91|nr:PAS domain-containing protein [Bacilliculturomica massiliensis]